MIGELATQVALALGVLAAFLLGPGLTITFLILRRSRSLAARRSPIGINLLRGPGHTLGEQLEEETNNVIWDLLLLSAFPVVMLALYLAQAHLLGWARMLPHTRLQSRLVEY